MTLPSGYWIEMGGAFENQQRAMARLSMIVPLTIGFILVLLFTAFNSLRHATLYDALAMNEAAVHELGYATLKKIAVELSMSLRKPVTVEWAKRETVRAKLRVMVKTLLRRYKYPLDRQEEATETVLRQVESLSEEWTAAA